MNRLVSPVWKAPWPDLRPALEAAVSAGIRKAAGPVRIFFRADDIGIPGKRFSDMTDLFLAGRVPLNLAVVPAWLNPRRWEVLRGMTDLRAPELWCWHQHGWRHRSHELQGKKQEFGPARSEAAIAADILRGKNKLESLMKDRFTPVFTPPWNRCDERAMAALKETGFLALSRHCRSHSGPIPGLPDFPVHVDLHTRREADPETGRAALLNEITAAVSGGLCGVMIHHQRMNRAAMEFQEILLAVVKKTDRMVPVNFKDLIHG